MTLQELIEKGYIEKIEQEATFVGTAYDITVNLHRYSISSLVVKTGIDESLDEAVALINSMVEFIGALPRQESPLHGLMSNDGQENEELLQKIGKVFKD